jgi:hypothetical protein
VETDHNESFGPLVLVAAAKLLPGAQEHHGLGYDGGEHGQPHHQEHDLEQPAKQSQLTLTLFLNEDSGDHTIK